MRSLDGLFVVAEIVLHLLLVAHVRSDQVPAASNNVPLDIRSPDPVAFADWKYDHVVVPNTCGGEVVVQFHPDPNVASKVAGTTQCKLKPTVYYVVDDKSSFDRAVHGSLPNNCKLTYICTHSASGQRICSDTPVLWDGKASSAKAGSAIFTNEQGCDFTVGGTAYRRWIEVTPDLSQIATSVYQSENKHTLINGGKDFTMKIARFDLGPAVVEDYDDVMFTSHSFQYDSCQACRECKGSRFMGWETRANEKFHMTFFVKQTCSWAKVCVDTEFDKNFPASSKSAKCKNGMMIHFDFKSKVVIYGVKNEAIKVNFINSDKLNRIDLVRPDDKSIAISTSTREKISLPAYVTGQISLLAENDACIEGTTLGLTTAMGCAAGTTPQNSPIKAESETETTYAPKDVPTPPATFDFDILTTTPVPPVPPPSNVARNDPGAQNRRPQSMEEAVRGKKGWMTWGVFLGSLLGSTFGMLICASIFYFCRRTVYNSWYRGMYKRYKCDASGTTGGATGAEFGATTGGGMTTVGTIASECSTTATTSTMSTGSMMSTTNLSTLGTETNTVSTFDTTGTTGGTTGTTGITI